MKNKTLLSICYKFFNRFITADVLIKQLSGLDKTGFSARELEETSKLLDGIKKISAEIPNRVDERVLAEKAHAKKLVERLERIPKTAENADFLNSQLRIARRNYIRERDCHKRWNAIAGFIWTNRYFDETFKSLTDYELLEFIALNLPLSFSPLLSKEKFDKLVEVGIKNDKREWLFRLAVCYAEKGLNLDRIVDYYTQKKDDYYLAELYGAVGEYLKLK